jgi:branched-chain amino acid transport system substrate-binding protein
MTQKSKLRLPGMTRRDMMKAGIAATAIAAAPGYMRTAGAAVPIKIGIPTVITGGYAVLGEHVQRTANLVKKMTDEAGGVLGRPIEFLFKDSQGDPATCVRKCQELVERDDCRIFTGVVVSSEARAIMPQLDEWNAFFISHGNGDGKLTAELLVPNFFRANTSAPMGARTLALYLKNAEQSDFFAIGSDYAWGHSSVEAFETQIQNVGKNFVDKVFAPVGNKDYSTYITKIMQSGAQGCYVALQGDEGRAFYSQAQQYGLSTRVTMVTEIVAQANIRALGSDSVGLVGSSRYPFTYDTPENNAFVARFREELPGELPDWTDGEMKQALDVLFAAMEKADSTEAKDIVAAMEGLEVTSVKGATLMRQCDHQGENQGFVVRVSESADYGEPIPEILEIYPREQITPNCNSTEYDN